MSKPTKTEADKAHELREELKVIKEAANEHFFRMGEVLREIKDKEYWKMGWASFEAYYSDPELSIPSSTVYHSIKVVDKFSDWKKIVDIPISKLIAIAPHVNEKNRTDLIVASRVLSRGDLRHELLDHGLQPERKTVLAMPKVYPCKVCKKMKGLGFDDLCHCGWTPSQIEAVGKLIDKIEFGGGIDE